MQQHESCGLVRTRPNHLVFEPTRSDLDEAVVGHYHCAWFLPCSDEVDAAQRGQKSLPQPMTGRASLARLRPPYADRRNHLRPNSFCRVLYPEISMLDVGGGGKLARRSRPGDTTAFDDVMADGDLD